MSVVTRACVQTRVHGGRSFRQRCCVLTSSQLHKGLEPKVGYVFPSPWCLRFSPVSQVHSRMHPLLSLLFFSPLSVLLVLVLSTSVPVLVLVVPAVEVYVERHNAAGCHASDQSPEGRAHRVNRIQPHTHVTARLLITEDSLLPQLPRQTPSEPALPLVM